MSALAVGDVGSADRGGGGNADCRACLAHDHGLTGTNRERPGLQQALAACRAGDTLVVTKLDRLARSLPDAPAIADELTQREVKLNLGGSVQIDDLPRDRARRRTNAQELSSDDRVRNDARGVGPSR